MIFEKFSNVDRSVEDNINSSVSQMLGVPNISSEGIIHAELQKDGEKSDACVLKNFIFLGAPGAGKGTQASHVSKVLGIPSISSGDIIRAELKKGGEKAEKFKLYSEKGLLVPDEMIVEIICDRIKEEDCCNGFILDGFPRTISQAQALEKMVHIDRVINIVVDAETIYKRMSGRCVCEKCGAVFNSVAEMRPKSEGVCDLCGGALVRRTDDEEQTVRERLKVYHDQTFPLEEFYTKKGVLVSIDGSRDFSLTSLDVLKAVGVQ
ncbi:MAG: adenylate kinase [Oscillospiraceae bacterium]|nr:adenylate kinase [Oscillospiraceae bacterium]